MNIGVIGLGHVFEKSYLALKQEFNNIELCDSTGKYGSIKDYKKMKSKYIIVNTPPITHLQVLKDLINLNKFVLAEKPVVMNLEEFEELKRITNENNFYNMLHFSFGKEIDFYKKHFDKKPKKIKVLITDNYVKDNKIIVPNLKGSYLDETINPISAICRIFGYNIKFINVEKKKFPNEQDDYYSLSYFKIDDIDVEIKVIWNNKQSEKYMDFIFDKDIVRLDSMNQAIIKNRELIYQAEGNRMVNHYLGIIHDFKANKSNIRNSYKIYDEFLKGV